MNASDVIGHIVDGTYYCNDCVPTSDTMPIFGDSETDSFNHCEVCEALIPETLTDDGLTGVKAVIHAYLVSRKGRPEILVQWARELREYAGTYDEARWLADMMIEVYCLIVKQAEAADGKT